MLANVDKWPHPIYLSELIVFIGQFLIDLSFFYAEK